MTELATTNGSQVAARERPALLAPFDPVALGLPADFTGQMAYAEFVSTSDLVPKALQGKPANVFLIMQKAIALSLPWDVAMSGIHVIDAKVTCGAKLLRMLVRKAGHDLDPHTITDKEAKATLTLSHRPNKPIEITYTIAEAQTAGLTNKQVWKNYVKSMLVAAVTRRAVDWHCPEVAMGLDLSDETLAATFGDTSAPIRATAEIVGDSAPAGAIPAPRQPTDDTPAGITPEAAPEIDPLLTKALEVLEKAGEATDVGTLTRIGKEARTNKLLDQPVGTTEDGNPLSLKDALMVRMREVESGQQTPA